MYVVTIYNITATSTYKSEREKANQQILSLRECDRTRKNVPRSNVLFEGETNSFQLR